MHASHVGAHHRWLARLRAAVGDGQEGERHGLGVRQACGGQWDHRVAHGGDLVYQRLAASVRPVGVHLPSPRPGVGQRQQRDGGETSAAGRLGELCALLQQRAVLRRAVCVGAQLPARLVVNTQVVVHDLPRRRHHRRQPHGHAARTGQPPYHRPRATTVALRRRTSAEPPLSRVALAIAAAVKGAMYFAAAVPDPGAATRVVDAIAPVSSSSRRTPPTALSLRPMAT